MTRDSMLLCFVLFVMAAVPIIAQIYEKPVTLTIQKWECTKAINNECVQYNRKN